MFNQVYSDTLGSVADKEKAAFATANGVIFKKSKEGYAMPQDIVLEEGKRVLLSELRYEKLEILESEEGKPTKIRCIAQVADEKNLNGRVYKRSILEREIQKANETLARRPGLANHPEGTPKVENIAVLWDEFIMDGNNVMATGNIVPTRAGQDVEAVARAGVEVGVSSRGFGSQTRGEWQGEDALIVADDYDFITCDIVVDPSVDSARILSVETTEPSDYSTLTLDGLIDNREDLVQEIEAIAEAVWSTKFKNSLPDMAFAIVLPGGTKDADGRTKPRSLRKLPHHNETVRSPDEKDSVDMVHLRDALSRCPQMKGVTEEQRAKAQSHLDKHKAQFGMTDSRERDTDLNDEKDIGATLDAENKGTPITEPTVEDAKVETVEEKNPLQEQLDEATAKVESMAADLAEAKAKVEEVKNSLTNAIAEQTAKYEETVAKLAEVDAEKTAIAEDAQNMKNIIDLCAKEIGEKAKAKDFYSAGMMANMGDMMAYLHSRDAQNTAESLRIATESVLAFYAMHNLHSLILERCRPERYSWPLADALIAQCKTKEEVDARFFEIKAQAESAQKPNMPQTRGQVHDESNLSPLDKAVLEKMRELREAKI